MKYCNHSSKSYRAILFNGTFKPTQGKLTMCVVGVVGLKLGSSMYTSTTLRTPSNNETSRMSSCSFTPSRLAGKAFAILIIYMELTLGTQKRSCHVVDWTRTASNSKYPCKACKLLIFISNEAP